MERLEFIFWESTKVLILIFLGLVSVKAVGALKPRDASGGVRWLRPLRYVLYALILALVVLGARIAGYDFAAETYYAVSSGNLHRREIDKAYSNALRAVELRPGILRYWQQLAEVKVLGHQYASAIQDESKIKELSGGQLAEDDAMRLAASDLASGDYDGVIRITTNLLRARPDYPVPYLLKGQAFLSLKDYDHAEKTFLQVLGFAPTITPAVDGLASAYYLAGDTSRCLAVLNATEK
ncbi:MAG: tetratricopeptide repeat protein, partial [Terriglobia bacterium]